ncbi:hypothetical protein IMZ48_18615, partial [Candidatus Bathyarchaeota archaeon]|nr:hypothetical protein [Candidatus Bathyarchaeota archaeon]
PLSGIPFIDKVSKRLSSGEKNKRLSGAAGSSKNGDDGEELVEESNDRNLYFNLPLPPQLLDETGAPKKTFTRNKIRTAKYTPLSFVVKNLWIQFHNIANIFFLFVVILVVSSPGCPLPSPHWE